MSFHFARSCRSALLLYAGGFLLGGSAPAAETLTVGWHIPAEATEEFAGQSPEARKLNHPTGESAFFQPGDALGEVSQIFGRDVALESDGSVRDRTLAWTGEWVVWDERSQMLVARGTRNEILGLEQSMGFAASPLSVGTRVELRRTGARVEALSVTSRSNEKASFEIHGGAKVKVIPTISKNAHGATTQVEFSWPEAGEPDAQAWRLETQVSSADGEPTLIAKHGALEIWLTTELRLVDGTPLMKARWREAADGSIHPWPGRGEDAQPVMNELPSGQWAAWCRVPKDPENCCEDRRTPVTLPAVAEAVAHGRFVTLGETPAGRVEAVKAEAGGRLDWEGFLAAEDETGSTLLLLGRKETVEAVAATMADPPDAALPTVVEVTATTGPDGDPFILSCDSGAKASMYRDEEKGTKMGLQIEPVVAKEFPDHLDLRYTLHLGLPSGQSSSGAAGLAPGMFFPPLGVGERRVSATWRKLTAE